MSSERLLTTVTLLAIVIGIAEFQSFDIQQECLDCICEASTGCDLLIGCNDKGPGEYNCGPYQIGIEFWIDAGRPGNNPSNPLAFEECLNEKKCSEVAIKAYMRRYGRDCDNDGIISCMDYASIHKAGPNGCNSTWIWRSTYGETFINCFQF